MIYSFDIQDNDKTQLTNVYKVTCYPNSSGYLFNIFHVDDKTRTLHLPYSIGWDTLAPVEIKGDML